MKTEEQALLLEARIQRYTRKCNFETLVTNKYICLRFVNAFSA
jgi:hypothetical protein